MQRALSSRTNVLSAAAKRAPFSRSTGLNLQQQRFAHKVRDTNLIPLTFK
jgi:chaperonin GroEL